MTRHEMRRHSCNKGVIRLLTSSATNEHLDGAFWPEIGFHNIVQSLRCVDVHEQSCAPPHDLSLGVERLDRRHLVAKLPPTLAYSAPLR